ADFRSPAERRRQRRAYDRAKAMLASADQVVAGDGLRSLARPCDFEEAANKAPKDEEREIGTAKNRAPNSQQYWSWWRRGWDSNPRAGYPTRRFRGAPVTTTSVPLRSCAAGGPEGPPLRTVHVTGVTGTSDYTFLL